MSSAIPLLVLCPLQAEYMQQFRDRFETIEAGDDARRAQAIAAHGPRIRAVLTIGTIGLTALEIAALPALEVVHTLGVGYEQVDVAAAKSRGIAVANAAGSNATCVADHAFGLLLAAVRGIVQMDVGVRRGLWRDQLTVYTPTVSGKRMGLLGMGDIGKQIAKRAAGFDMPVGYHSRSAKPELPHRYFDSVRALAEWADYLVVATPGGAETRHLVNAEVLQALGPKGTLVNIARGSVVDTAALATALRAGHIASAGIDVYESEPAPPAELLDIANVVITPHIAGRSPEAIQGSVTLVLDNLEAFFAGRPMPTLL
ncbi:2-hydroxyacid dehydrogenase [Pseudorhodoferax soli]|uniref:Lactate dehydrogenase-like 2-hydroxyacid dehydrogenase n=1 Tax=Pseudorhodoferax soli TaxID=545864 RepID=A0A368XL98_9BURK|nr:2-hydroxyacid dehydrogenase [Pseudorhodoferax soli]RCW68743.1 lactate dehydrogenase-like 2-hydroxyacid dehydrogenase [Pseudorhodoferax soli]